MLRRTLGGYAMHPNFACVLMIGLGCETNQIADLLTAQGLEAGELLRTFTIQGTGGTSKTIASGITQIKSLLAEANRANGALLARRRREVNWSLRHLGRGEAAPAYDAQGCNTVVKASVPLAVV